MLNRRSALSAVADIAIVLLALAVVTQVGLQITDRLRPSSPRQPAVRSAPPVPEYSQGDPMPQVAKLGLPEADFTLLMFLRSSCRYCTESMPFYSRLKEARDRGAGSVRLAALSAEPQDLLDGYLSAYKVAVDSTVALSPSQFSEFRVRGTPTLILVDRKNVVRKVWIGLLEPAQEAEVLTAVEGGLRPN